VNSPRTGEGPGPQVRDSDTVPFAAVTDEPPHPEPEPAQPEAAPDTELTTVFGAVADDPEETSVFTRPADLAGAGHPGSGAEVGGSAGAERAAGSGEETPGHDPDAEYDGVDDYGGEYYDDGFEDDFDDEEQPMRTRRRGPLIVLGVFFAIIFGGSYLLYRSFFGAPDFDGTGQGDVIVQVNDGDTTSAIGGTLARMGVVRSQKAFTQAAAEDEQRARSVQPGYYRLRLGMSGESAVKLLLDSRSRVGRLEIKGGVQLDDTRGPDGTVAPGVLTQLAQATCTQLNGSSTCVGVGQLREAMAKSPLEALGVPDWARADVARAEPYRRLEGLIAPGRYDVRPGSNAEEVLRVVVSRSATQYEASGLLSGAAAAPASAPTSAPASSTAPVPATPGAAAPGAAGSATAGTAPTRPTQTPATATLAGQDRFTPYQLLVIASLVEKEGTTADFDKVSQVIHNRLTARSRLELDSTVNYPLDLQSVRTSAGDRGRAGPYNSYANYGLPPTPIGAPGTRAIEAALHPAPGPWMFFVKCKADGTSCFATTLAEHQANVRAAQAAGVY
jgi:UPF0755 protein